METLYDQHFFFSDQQDDSLRLLPLSSDNSIHSEQRSPSQTKLYFHHVGIEFPLFYKVGPNQAPLEGTLVQTPDWFLILFCSVYGYFISCMNRFLSLGIVLFRYVNVCQVLLVDSDDSIIKPPERVALKT